MKNIRKPVGRYDKLYNGRVVHIDFTYSDNIIVWVEYKTVCKAYRFVG